MPLLGNSGKRSAVPVAVSIMLCLGSIRGEAHNIPVTYVSGKGADSSNCSSPANPCRTFQFAFDHTASGGEIKALDAADYGPVHIR